MVRPFSLPVVWEVNAPVEELKASFPEGAERDALIRSENRKRRLLARLVDAGIGVSEVLRKYIRDFLGIKKAFSIPNGSDPSLFESENLQETALVHLKDKFKVCWAGNAENPWQGIDLILETAKRMQHIDPSIIFIVITGNSFWKFPVLKNVLVLRQIPYADLPTTLLQLMYAFVSIKGMIGVNGDFITLPLNYLTTWQRENRLLLPIGDRFLPLLRMGSTG